MAEMYEDEDGNWVSVKKPPTLKTVIRSVLLESLAFAGGRQKDAANILGITPRIMNYQMKKYGIPRARAYKLVRRNRSTKNDA